MRSFFGKIFGFDKEIRNLKFELNVSYQETENFVKQANLNKKRIEQLQNEATQLLNELDLLKKQVQIPHPKEKFWNNKYPKQDISYNARVFFNSKTITPVDVRIFFQTNDFNLKKIVNTTWVGIGKLNTGTCDERALKCLKWVHKFFKYVSDKEVVGLFEFWMFVFEALKYKKGDCDDGAILLANLMQVAGIPYWRIRLNAGDVKGGGHCYVTYCRETDNDFVVLDWCYWYNKTLIAARDLHKDQRDYYGIWLNERYAFGEMQTMKGMPKILKVKR